MTELTLKKETPNLNTIEEEPPATLKAMGDGNTIEQEPETFLKNHEIRFEKLIENLNEEMRGWKKGKDAVEDKMVTTEKNTKSRIESQENLKNLFQSEDDTIKRHLERSDKFFQEVQRHEELIKSWQCLIDSYRRVPGDLQILNLKRHFN